MPLHGYICQSCKNGQDLVYSVHETAPDKTQAHCDTCGGVTPHERTWAGHLPMIGQVPGAGLSPARTRKRKGTRGK